MKSDATGALDEFLSRHQLAGHSRSEGEGLPPPKTYRGQRRDMALELEEGSWWSWAGTDPTCETRALAGTRNSGPRAPRYHSPREERPAPLQVWGVAIQAPNVPGGIALKCWFSWI